MISIDAESSVSEDESVGRPPVSNYRHAWVGIVAYGILALFAYAPAWPGRAHVVPWCACGDTAQQIWYLDWTPFAVLHGHPLLTSNWIDLPGGVNLAQNVSMPLLGVLAAPVTLTLGPVAAFNTLLWFSLAASASSCFLVLLRWVTWKPAAFAGGLLYAFSSYIAGQALGHLNLIFVPLPPLLVLALNELVVEQRGSGRRWGIALGLLSAAQFLVSPELLLDSVILAVVGILFLAALHVGEVARRLRHAVTGLAWAMVVFVPVAAYPLWVYLAGPSRYHGSAWNGSTFPEDLLGSVIPSSNQRVTTGGIAAFGDRLQNNLAENGAYLGVTLVVVLLAIAVHYRRVGIIRFFSCMALAAWVLSLGPRLQVGGHPTALVLPFRVFVHLPVLDSLLAGRFTLFVDLFCGFVLALGIDRLRSAMLRRTAVPRARVTAVLLLVLAVCLAPLVPRWPYPVVPIDSTTPAFFTTPPVRAIPQDSAVLTYPYPVTPFNQAMLWQAVSGMRFRILGGYALVPAADGSATSGPAPVTPASVPATLIAYYAGQDPGSGAASAQDVRALVRRYHVSTVVAGPGGVHRDAAVALFTAALGPPRTVSGIDLWTVPGNR